MANAILLPKGFRLHPRTGLTWQDPRDIARVWTPDQAFVWEKASYTVPGEVSEERVQATGERYRRKLGKLLEWQGWTVLGFDGPIWDRSIISYGLTDPDRRRYVLYAKVTRRPQTITVDVPDEDVAIYQKAGFKLVQ